MLVNSPLVKKVLPDVVCARVLRERRKKHIKPILPWYYTLRYLQHLTWKCTGKNSSDWLQNSDEWEWKETWSTLDGLRSDGLGLITSRMPHEKIVWYSWAVHRIQWCGNKLLALPYGHTNLSPNKVGGACRGRWSAMLSASSLWML